MKFLPLSAYRIWLGLPIILVVLILAVLAGRFFLGQQGRVEEALLTGQRLEISLLTGEVQGRLRPGVEETTKVAAADKAAPAVPGAAATGDKAVKAAATPKQKTFADVEDYIGPRLPEKAMAKIEVETVSLKDLEQAPVIVVIVKGLGLSSSTTEDALALPASVTLGFSPYSPSIKDWSKQAIAAGHEIILNVPMETRDYRVDDPGPYALLTSSSKDDNTTRLKMLLSLVDGYRAVYSENDEMFTQSIAAVRPVLKTLKEQNTYFIYGGGYADFSLIQVANNLSYPLLVSDAVIDDDITADSITAKLVDIEKIAKEKGFAVAMAHPYPISVRILDQWLPEVQKRGIRVMPVSFLLGKSFK